MFVAYENSCLRSVVCYGRGFYPSVDGLRAEDDDGTCNSSYALSSFCCFVAVVFKIILTLFLIFHRRKPQNLTPPLSSDSANSLSPRASPSGNKRASSASSAGSVASAAGGAVPGAALPALGADEAPAAKKQRISHYRRPSPPSSGYATTSSGERQASDNEDDRTTG